MAELADAPDLGSGGEIRRGSSPLSGTFNRGHQPGSQHERMSKSRKEPEEAGVKRLTLGEIESVARSRRVAMATRTKRMSKCGFCTVRPATDVQSALAPLFLVPELHTPRDIGSREAPPVCNHDDEQSCRPVRSAKPRTRTDCHFQQRHDSSESSRQRRTQRAATAPS